MFKDFLFSRFFLFFGPVVIFIGGAIALAVTTAAPAHIVVSLLVIGMCLAWATMIGIQKSRLSLWLKLNPKPKTQLRLNFKGSYGDKETYSITKVVPDEPQSYDVFPKLGWKMQEQRVSLYDLPTEIKEMVVNPTHSYSSADFYAKNREAASEFFDKVVEFENTKVVDTAIKIATLE